MNCYAGQLLPPGQAFGKKGFYGTFLVLINFHFNFSYKQKCFETELFHKEDERTNFESNTVLLILVQ